MSDFVNQSYDHRLDWTPLRPITISTSILNVSIYCAFDKNESRQNTFMKEKREGRIISIIIPIILIIIIIIIIIIMIVIIVIIK